MLVFKALFALNIFAENMEEKINEYVPIIVPKLLKFLEEKTDIQLRTQKECLSALSSCITSAGLSYKPYLDVTLTRMICLLQLTKVEQLTLRAEATKVLSHLVNVFSKNDDLFYK